MSKLWVAASLVMIIGIVSTLFLINRWENMPVDLKKSSQTSLDLKEVVENPSQWQKYLELKDALIGHWKRSSPGKPRIQSDPMTQSVLRRQIDELKQMFDEEDRQKREHLEKTIAEYTKARHEQTALLLKDRNVDLNNRLARELADKLAHNQSRVKAFRQQLQFEAQTTLSNLQIQRVMLDFSLEISEPEMEKSKIDAEIARIGQEIEVKVSKEQTRLQGEYEHYAAMCKRKNQEELAAYRRTLEERMQQEIRDFRNQLQNEFEKWQSTRKFQRDQAVKSRQNGSTIQTR